MMDNVWNKTGLELKQIPVWMKQMQGKKISMKDQLMLHVGAEAENIQEHQGFQRPAAVQEHQ